MGGGLDFALSCDYRIASPAARFSHPGPRLGLFTGWGGTAALPRRSGVARAALLTGAVLPAREALAAGWIEEMAADPLRRAVARARSSAGADLGRLKRLRRAEGLPLSVALEVERLLALEPREEG
jgi:enoyl-CoA hydratase/carnithine racemase